MSTAMPFVVRSLAVATVLLAVNVARAHIDMLSPTAREVDQKQGPCGVSGGTRGDKVTTVRAGSTLRVTWRETINHPSHFRISFDADGDDDFVDPASIEERFSNDAVLLDGLSDAAGGTFTADVVLPDIPCERCTLQLIQVMYDKKPYVVGTNDIYYRCADLTLTKDASDTPPDANEPPPSEAEDAGPLDDSDTERDTSPASGVDRDEASSPDEDAERRAENATIAGESCDASSGHGSAQASVWPLFLGLSAFAFARRAQRRRRLVLASARESQAPRENR